MDILGDTDETVHQSEMEMGRKQEGTKNEEERPQIEKQPMSHLLQMKPIVPQASSHAATVSSGQFFSQSITDF